MMKTINKILLGLVLAFGINGFNNAILGDKEVRKERVALANRPYLSQLMEKRNRLWLELSDYQTTANQIKSFISKENIQYYRIQTFDCLDSELSKTEEKMPSLENSIALLEKEIAGIYNKDTELKNCHQKIRKYARRTFLPPLC